MAVTPLAPAQQSAIDALVTGRRVEPVPADPKRAAAFVRNAAEALVDVPNATRPQNRYNLAYDACHDVGEALLAAYGYRTVNGPGQHQALGQFLRAVFDTPPGDAAARRFDQLRRARNQQRYDAAPITASVADLAANVARALHDAAVKRGISA
jgi:hypothetical protein